MCVSALEVGGAPPDVLSDVAASLLDVDETVSDAIDQRRCDLESDNAGDFKFMIADEKDIFDSDRKKVGESATRLGVSQKRSLDQGSPRQREAIVAGEVRPRRLSSSSLRSKAVEVRIQLHNSLSYVKDR